MCNIRDFKVHLRPLMENYKPRNHNTGRHKPRNHNTGRHKPRNHNTSRHKPRNHTILLFGCPHCILHMTMSLILEELCTHYQLSRWLIAKYWCMLTMSNTTWPQLTCQNWSHLTNLKEAWDHHGISIIWLNIALTPNAMEIIRGRAKIWITCAVQTSSQKKSF